MARSASSEESLSALKTIIDVAHLGTWIWNVQTGETLFNDYWAEMLGFTLEELQPTSIETWLHFLHPKDQAVSEQALNAHFSGQTETYDCEVRVQHKAGHWLWIRDFGKVISWTDNGDPEWVSGAHLDVTNQKELEQRLRSERDANRELSATLEKAQQIGNLGYWKADLDRGDLYWSSKVYDIFGMDEEDFTPTVEAFRSFVHPEDRDLLEASHAHALKTGIQDVEHRIVRPDGGIRWVHERADSVSEDGDSVLIGTVRDISQQKELEHQLLSMSYTDALTQINNRRAFMQRLVENFQLFQRRNTPAAVLMVDVDHFKRINDYYGHNVGDSVIRSIAATLSGRVRESDIAGRIGGEEFGVILPGAEFTEAVDMAERLRHGIESRLHRAEDGDVFNVTITIGVSEFLNDDSHYESVLRRADYALYQGKESGRNRIVRYPSLDVDSG